MALGTVSFAIRTLRRQPALSLIAVLVLAAGLGFSIASFSMVNTLLFHPYPYPEIDRLVIVRDHHLADGAHQGNPIELFRRPSGAQRHRTAVRAGRRRSRPRRSRRPQSSLLEDPVRP